MTLPLLEDRLFVDDLSTVKKYNILQDHLYTVIDPRTTEIIGIAQGHTFTQPVKTRSMNTYIIFLADGQQLTLFADSHETATFLMLAMFDEDMVVKLEVEQTFHSIVWTRGA